MLPQPFNYQPTDSYPASAAIDRAVSHIGDPGGLVGEHKVSVWAGTGNSVWGLTAEEADALIEELTEDPTVERIELDGEEVYKAEPVRPPNVIETGLGRKITVNNWGRGSRQLVVEEAGGGRVIYAALSADEASRLAELLTS